MIIHLEKQRSTLSYRILSAFIAFAFIFSSIMPPAPVYAQLIPQGLAGMPLPGAMVPLSPGFTPAMVTGITIHPVPLKNEPGGIIASPHPYPYPCIIVLQLLGDVGDLTGRCRKGCVSHHFCLEPG